MSLLSSWLFYLISVEEGEIISVTVESFYSNYYERTFEGKSIELLTDPSAFCRFFIFKLFFRLLLIILLTTFLGAD